MEPKTNTAASDVRSMHGLGRRQYLKHIRRLQAEKAVLASMLAEERAKRCEAYRWYQRRLHSRWWSAFDFIMMSQPEVLRRPNDSSSAATHGH